jgi:hypothetical protein
MPAGFSLVFAAGRDDSSLMVRLWLQRSSLRLTREGQNEPSLLRGVFEGEAVSRSWPNSWLLIVPTKGFNPHHRLKVRQGA